MRLAPSIDRDPNSVVRSNANGASALVSALAAGVSHAVVSPGSRNTPIALALHESPIETHVVLDERSAGFYALGLARASGQPVVLSCTSGSAGAHYLPAIVEAFESLTPLIALTADRPPELHGHAAPQTTEQRGFYQNHVARRFDLPLADETAPDDFFGLAREALRCARDEARPVHINAPIREPLWAPEVEYSVAAPDELPPAARDVFPSVKALIRSLGSTKRGLVIAGPRSRQDQLAQDTTFALVCHQVAARLGWPLLADVTSGVRSDQGTDATVVSGYDSILRSKVFARENLPEHVLLLGRPSTSKTLNRWLSENRLPTTLVSDVPKHRDPSLRIVAEVEDSPLMVLRGFLELSENHAHDTEWCARWAAAESAFRSLNDDDSGFWEGSVARTVARSMPASSLLHVSSSMPIRDVDGFAGLLPKRVTVTANRGVNGIDGIIATAAGHARGWREGPSVLLIGDLAFLHDIGSLRIAAATPLTVVIVNNGGGHIFDFLPIAKHSDAFERYFLTPHEANIGALCAGFGIEHRLVSGTDALRHELQRSVSQAGFEVLEVRLDGADNRAVHERFYRAVEGRLQ